MSGVFIGLTRSALKFLRRSSGAKPRPGAIHNIQQFQTQNLARLGCNPDPFVNPQGTQTYYPLSVADAEDLFPLDLRQLQVGQEVPHLLPSRTAQRMKGIPIQSGAADQFPIDPLGIEHLQAGMATAAVGVESPLVERHHPASDPPAVWQGRRPLAVDRNRSPGSG
jgi:hypothetical protein